jgi:hypothetical protein
MPHMLLRQKLRELCKSTSTLLWLEGAKHDRILGVTLQSERLLLQLANGTTRIVAFDKVIVTTVGLQFWSQGRPGVLYIWEQVPKATWLSGEQGTQSQDVPFQDCLEDDDDGGYEPPPDMAA